MAWLWLSLAVAFLQGLKDLAIRRSSGTGDAVVLACGYNFVTFLALAPAALVEGVPEVRAGIWHPLLAGGAMLVAANILYFAALRASDLSLTAPMLTFTPIFLLATSPAMIGEVAAPGGIAGIGLIVAGAYVLNLRRGGGSLGLLAPFRALARERGPRLMLMVAAIWGITANYDRMGIDNSGPLFWGALISLAGSLGLLPLALVRMRRCGGLCGAAGPSLRTMALTGAAEGLSLGLQMYALTLAIVPYVIAVKRTSAVMGVILGTLMLGERGLKARLAGAVLMVAGVWLVAAFK